MIIILTIIFASIVLALEFVIVYRFTSKDKIRKVEELETAAYILRKENKELRARIEQSRIGRTYWLYGKGTYTAGEFTELGKEGAARSVLGETMVASIFKEYPNFIRDFVECGYRRKPDGIYEVWWQFKAQEKVVKGRDMYVNRNGNE